LIITVAAAEIVSTIASPSQNSSSAKDVMLMKVSPASLFFSFPNLGGVAASGNVLRGSETPLANGEVHSSWWDANGLPHRRMGF